VEERHRPGAFARNYARSATLFFNFRISVQMGLNSCPRDRSDSKYGS